jgi:hypothetical protein
MWKFRYWNRILYLVLDQVIIHDLAPGKVRKPGPYRWSPWLPGTRISRGVVSTPPHAHTYSMPTLLAAQGIPDLLVEPMVNYHLRVL